MRPIWQRVRTLESPREDQDCPKEGARVPAVGCKMATQRQNNMVKIAPKWYEVKGFGGPLEKTKMVQQKTDGDFPMSQRLLLKGKARWSRYHQYGTEKEHWAPREDQDGPMQGTRGLGVGTKMATQGTHKMAKVRPRWQIVKMLESSAEDQDGPTEETRAPSVGCNIVTQRKSKMVQIAPRCHRVRTWGSHG